MPFKNFRISEKLSSLPTLPLGQLTELQGDLKDLTKSNYSKLKSQIEKKGFRMPLFVWFNQETNENLLLDGTQRCRLLTKEGVSLETLLPIVYIEAASPEDAKETLLAITSQFGTITQEGYDTFTWDLDEAYLQEMTHFDALKAWEEEVAGELANPYDEWTGMPEYEQEDKLGIHVIVHFNTVEDKLNFFKLVDWKGTADTKSIWYPERPPELTDQLGTKEGLIYK